MAIRYWQPFREMDYMRQQLDELFSDIADIAPTVDVWAPAVRLVDAGDAYRLLVQLPGVAAADVDVQATREAVVIAGRRNAAEVSEGQRVLHDGLRYGSFRRVVTLPDAIENSAVSASFEHGLLMLTLPKVAEARNKVVKVNLGGHSAVDTPAIAGEGTDSADS